MVAQASAVAMDAMVESGRGLRNAHWFFFDLDGTLADSVSGLHGSISAAFAAVGRELPVQDIRPFVGPGIRIILKNMAPSLTTVEIDTMERTFRADYDNAGVLRTEMFAGVHAALDTLHALGKIAAVVTNKPKLATGRLLQKHGLVESFAAIVSRDSQTPPFTTKGEMLQATMLDLHAAQDRSVMIGDTAEDAEAAHDAGVRFVHAAYGYGSVEGGAHIAIGGIAELLALLTPVATGKAER